ncbi:MAG: single-stranded DNA-binding protein [Chlorobiaceae bacterium]
MAELKMPEINSVIIAGNLTKNPVFRQTNSGGTPVVNFSIACNRRFRDSNHQWQEDVCYVSVVAWNKLAESCRDNLKKSFAVLVDGELQSRTWKAQDGSSRTVVEIKAKRIQFLNKRKKSGEEDEDGFIEDDCNNTFHGEGCDEADHIYEYKYLSSD